MQTYKGFRPSAFDCAGLGCEDRQHWLVAPCSVNRDSDALARSNWRTMLKTLGGESENVEVHRFGHWACGWFEIVLVNPACESLVTEAESIENALSDYPVLSDEDFSELELEEHEAGHCDEHCSECEYAREHEAYENENG